MTSKATFARAARLLQVVYFKAAVSDETWLAYFMALSDIPDEALITAVSEHIAGSDEFPTIAQLRQSAVAGAYPLPGDAWGEVTRQMQQTGHYRQPVFSHPMIERAVDQAGGWQALCESDNPAADRAHFLRLFETLIRRETAGRAAFPAIEDPLPVSSGVPALTGMLNSVYADPPPDQPGD